GRHLRAPPGAARDPRRAGGGRASGGGHLLPGRAEPGRPQGSPDGDRHRRRGRLRGRPPVAGGHSGTAPGVLQRHGHRAGGGSEHPGLHLPGLLGRSGLPAGDRRPACRQLGTLLLLLNLRLDFAILGALAGAAPLGAYALASRFAELLRLLPVSVFWVFYPRYARAGRTVAAPQARAMIPRLGLLSLAVAIPLAPAAAAFFPWIFGSAFQVAVLPAQILLVGLVAEGIGGIV